MRVVERPAIDRAAFANRYGPWAVIAGASDGSGAAYAEELARMGISVVLVSRRQEALDTLGKRLAQTYGIQYRAVAVDLMSSGAGTRIVDAVADLDVGLYISNAGADGSGNGFLDAPLERSLRVLTMNSQTVIEAVHGLGNRFKARGRGGVVLMSSLSGMGGQPWLAMYAATKGFEINLAESLYAELRGQGVDVLGVGAPTMDTPSLRKAIEGIGWDISHAYDPADVAAVVLAKLGKQPMYFFPDGPEEAQIPEIEEQRRIRLEAMIAYAAQYDGSAQ